MSTPTIKLEPTLDNLALLKQRVEDARLESIKHPAYGNSATYQRTQREYQQAVRDYRRTNIKLVWNFEDDLMERIAA